MTDAEKETAIRAWIAALPPPIVTLVRRFPPGATVSANQPLTCPAPGEHGTVISYQESNRYHEDSVIVETDSMMASCDPEWLVVEDIVHVDPLLLRLLQETAN